MRDIERESYCCLYPNLKYFGKKRDDKEGVKISPPIYQLYALICIYIYIYIYITINLHILPTCFHTYRKNVVKILLYKYVYEQAYR